MIRKFEQLSRGKKIGVGLLLGFGILIAIGVSNPPKQANLQTTNTSQKSAVLGTQTERPKAKAPVVTTKEVTETEQIPFTSTIVNSASLAKGTSKVTTQGVNGTSTLTYKVTYTDGVETKKELVSKVVTIPPINQVTTVGTDIAPAPSPQPVASSSCDPNYSGACVPIASDVDCAGGSGNGPSYVQGPVRVIGSDIYSLDRDHNGIGCE